MKQNVIRQYLQTISLNLDRRISRHVLYCRSTVTRYKRSLALQLARNLLPVPAFIFLR